MGMRKFGSAAPPFSKVACVVKGQALYRASLQLDIDKCEFYKIEVLYLRLIISIDSVQIDPKKVKAIVNW